MMSLSLSLFLPQRREVLPLTIGMADNLASLSCILPARLPHLLPSLCPLSTCLH